MDFTTISYEAGDDDLRPALLSTALGLDAMAGGQKAFTSGKRVTPRVR